MRLIASTVLLALFATSAQAKLEIRDVQASHGVLGPERKSPEYVSGDEVYYRYTLSGVRTDADGRMRGELRLTVTDAKGKVVFRHEGALRELVGLGGDSVPAFASLELNEAIPSGEYEFAVEFTDLIAKESASFKRKFTCKPEEFAMVRVRFSHDAAGESAAAAGGLVRQKLFVRLKAVGFDRSKGEIDVAMEIAVLDAKGKPVLPRPLRAVIHNEKPEEVKQIERLSFGGELTLNRPGDFTLRVTVTDKLTGKKVTFETPLRVTAP